MGSAAAPASRFLSGLLALTSLHDGLQLIETLSSPSCISHDFIMAVDDKLKETSSLDLWLEGFTQKQAY